MGQAYVYISVEDRGETIPEDFKREDLREILQDRHLSAPAQLAGTASV